MAEEDVGVGQADERRAPSGPVLDAAPGAVVERFFEEGAPGGPLAEEGRILVAEEGRILAAEDGRILVVRGPLQSAGTLEQDVVVGRGFLGAVFGRGEDALGSKT